MSYDITIPLKVIGFAIGSTILFIVLHYIYVEKHTYKSWDGSERSYYEPRVWTIVLTVIILIFLLGLA